ncbi:glycoside hydrolase family 97 catalytic domain-containing protein [Salegentibacter sp. F188]|uniref:Glycoside hydrolase family 97 catalytic domain-containing protein n=1 Tax=Autumnicola patrickiae TaxID=3075591 RepID=A0ABU3DYK7_9FLAO|nr:glycoside hydrolase family 97 catalytic domain-containing protein [Salegentibacter sp. F188]MDT0688785.1 glycoside hydrolase family 97 catalytic domain-containing protein [Salegentibacter sp. F188]
MKNFFFVICLMGVFPFVMAQEATVKSPNDALKLDVYIESGIPTYTVLYNNEVVLEKSRLGLKTNISDYSDALNFEGSKTNSIEKNYESQKLKDSEINYNAQELTATFTTQKGRKMDVIFRVSNNDIAIRYHLHKYSDTIAHVVTKEFTGFNFPNTAKSFLTPQSKSMVGFQRTKPSYEEGYYLDQEITAASAHNMGYTFPGLFKTEDHWILLSETGVDGTYVGAHLSDPNAEGEYTIAFPDSTENNNFGSTGAAISLPFSTPWRTITIGESLKPIVETTIPFDVVEPLYEASQDYKFGRGVWSWIMWQDASMNYDDQVTYIDFAAEMGYEYILIDALWDQKIGYDRMEELIEYANSKNVDVFLWYNSNGVANDAPMTPRHKMHRAITRKQEMKWLQENGVKGLKVDFMGGDKQETIQLYEDIMSDANDHGLMMIFHGATLPRGWEILYPNFISTEAVLASENLMFSQYANDQEARSAAIHPFIRNTVGSMDFGGTVLNERYNRTNDGGNVRKTSDAFQLATAVLFQTPVQFFALTPNNLKDAPEFAVEFMKNVPTNWDETIFIDGYPGEYSVIARRHKEQWYVAGINASKEAKKVSFSLPELEGNKFGIINDNRKGKSEKKEIKSKKGKFEVTIQPQGGFIITN